MAGRNSSNNNNALVQLVVLTSLTAAVGALLFFGVYQKKRKQLGSAEQQQQQTARTHKHAVGATSPKDVAVTSKKQTPEPKSTPLPQKPKQQPDATSAAPSQSPQPPVAAAVAPPVNIGQEQATAATKKYKDGAFAEAVALYTDAIRLCEHAVPVDTRNLKVMFSNRAAAHERLHDFASVIADCSRALELDKRHPKSFLRRAKAKAALGELASALVDYVCLLVISEEKHEQIDEQLATEISRLHTALTAQELAAAAAKRSSTDGASAERFLPDQFFITSYYSSFHPSDDETDVVADEPSAAYTQALDALSQSDDTTTQRGLLLTKRALAFKREKAYDLAAKDLIDALPLVQPGDVAYYTAQLESGTFSHLRGDFATAKACFEHALAAKPSSIFAKIRMGGLSFDQKDMAQALAWFEQALAEKPECATAFFHRGQLHSIDIATDSPDTDAEAALALALRDLEQCIALAPDFAMAYIQLGVTHARTGSFEKAVACLETATAITPDVPEVYNYLGETYMQQLQLPDSTVAVETVEQLFEKAIALDPTYPMAYINLGNLMVSKGSAFGHAALALFERAVEMCPRSKFAYCHLAQVYMAMQDYARALTQIDHAIAYALSPDELHELFALRITAETHQQAQVLLQ